MVIANSSVGMTSTRAYTQSSLTQMSFNRRVVDTGHKENYLSFYQNLLGQKQDTQATNVNSSGNLTSGMSSIAQIKLQLLHKIFAAIFGQSGINCNTTENVSEDNSSGAAPIAGTLWERTVTSTVFYSESESVTYAAQGIAQTADGRTIDFGVELSMSRSFVEQYESYETQQYFVTDPLVINMDSNVTSLSDFKFLFDLDADGTEEEISFAGKGSGFLALDKNGDGIINDGTELFGTKSGDGFADLAAYDSDGNGWIDEADEVFSKLRVWTKDEYGNDELVDLKSADVGAIFLGRADTQFSLTDENNYAHGFMRATGIYLKESGGVSTISQVDLTS